jgi:asparagine synthase (glutamine-hydrolysing)
MCGITGWVNYERDISQEKNVILDMAERLKSRGPDDSGEYASKNALFGHRRLVVVDPSGGGQPMAKTLGGNTYIIVYNGELYNTEELRKTLLEKGYRFNSYSDTEVLLTSYINGRKNV